MCLPALTRDSDAILKLSRAEEARRRRSWEKQPAIISISSLAPRINGGFGGYFYYMIVFPHVCIEWFPARTAVRPTLDRTNTAEGSSQLVDPPVRADAALVAV